LFACLMAQRRLPRPVSASEETLIVREAAAT
jgi:hypothetical protein